jgi:hypothetical protein
MTKHKVFKTQDGSILIVNIEKRSDRDITITADEVTPVEYDDAVQSSADIFRDSSEELWREAVAAGNTTQSLDEWTEDVIENEDDTFMVDTSLYSETVTIDGTDYVFESGACGCLHEQILDVWPSAQVFVDAHLADMHTEANFIYNYEQKHNRKPAPFVVDEYLNKVEKQIEASNAAFEKLIGDDVDIMVEAIAKQIIEEL